MKLLVDGSPLLPLNRRAGPTGVGRFTSETLAALARMKPDWEIHFVVASLSAQAPDVSWMGPNVSFRMLKMPARVYRGLRHLRLLPPVEWTVGPADVSLGVNYIPLRARHAAEIPVVYDLSFIHHPETVSRKHLYFLKLVLPSVVRKAPAVVTISNVMRDEISEHYGVHTDKVHVVHPGCDLDLFGSDTHDEPQVANLPTDFFLYVGTLEPRKNLPGLLKAYLALKERRSDVPSLVLAGGTGWRIREFLNELSDASTRHDIRILGYVSDEDLRALYARAFALVFPSFYEGFGLPALEAMASGCPVIGSDRSGIKEVMGDAGLAVDPADPDAIADALELILDDDALRQDLIARGRERAQLFTWAASGEALASVLGAVGARQSSRSGKEA